MNMAYHEEFADRIRRALSDELGVTERRMFGGLGFMVDGNMAVAAGSDSGLMVRVDPSSEGQLVDEIHVHPMRMRGREMTGWLTIDADALQSDDQLRRFVELGVARARSFPPK